MSYLMMKEEDEEFELKSVVGSWDIYADRLKNALQAQEAFKRLDEVLRDQKVEIAVLQRFNYVLDNGIEMCNNQIGCNKYKFVYLE